VRIYTRHREPDLRHGLVSLLLAAFDPEPGDVWVISPWMRDVELPVADLGHFASVFGGHREQVRLSEMLARLAARHRLTLIVKPPGELVPYGEIRRLLEVVETRTQIQGERGIQDYDVVDRTLQTLKAEADALAAAAMQHADTLRMAWMLREQGAELLFLERLHAKLLWTPAGSLLGSANFTNGGFGGNEELMVEVTTADEHLGLEGAAREFAAHATPAAVYDLAAALRRVDVSVPEFRTWTSRLAAAGQDPLAELLRQLDSLIP
jgi:hypothetical protein